MRQLIRQLIWSNAPALMLGPGEMDGQTHSGAGVAPNKKGTRSYSKVCILGARGVSYSGCMQRVEAVHARDQREDWLPPLLAELAGQTLAAHAHGRRPPCRVCPLLPSA
jgi:hypothetical protein